MSKVTVTYIFPEEKEEFELHQSASELYSVIKECYEMVRSQLKHGEPSKAEEALENVKILCSHVLYN